MVNKNELVFSVIYIICLYQDTLTLNFYYEIHKPCDMHGLGTK